MSEELTFDAAVERIGRLVRDVDKLNLNWKNELGRRVDVEAERDALASVVTRQRSEIDLLRAAQEEARELLVSCWHQLDGPAFLLSDGTVHPGAVSTLHELDAYLWPDLQPGQERE